ncbi:hypothetical protein NQ314_002107 [Rhamnusium bicolor]|uniref:DDE Tnp4 domain-containing protein n=1 Tax=Rhamnusium bicolor TaxID=1586634 RepID=A0AAV8ZSF8_9CUCU|nr:hypothetical protein NQ314_002107 [Rhamnusium bicolor]
MLNGELLTEDSNSYRNFLRMSSEKFEYLLQQISIHINKKDTVMRQCIPARSKLEVTLRYLAGEETFRSLMYSTRIHETTISRFVPDVCKAIICFPPAETLPNQQYHLPYVIVGDIAFPLLKNLMKSYPERGLSHESRIFYYRLSRARRVIEHIFGILANQFRVLLYPINSSVEKVELFILTCVILNNFLANGNGSKYVDRNGKFGKFASHWTAVWK